LIIPLDVSENMALYNQTKITDKIYNYCRKKIYQRKLANDMVAPFFVEGPLKYMTQTMTKTYTVDWLEVS